ncbi:MAG: HD domain-containing protein [Candidatus Omnitrophica bacterium]|nr:HD domain-containing protein [Candidatus Omnitrophota bacterium]
MNALAVSEKEIFDKLIRQEFWKKLRADFGALLGHPEWHLSLNSDGAARKTAHYEHSIPLEVGDRLVGSLGLSGMKKGISREILRLLSSQVRMLCDNFAKTEEISRLSATIRPRAVALSTVHTVHRIINSTLNLDELMSRLAHLTAQVLRVKRCAIFLVEKPPAKPHKMGLCCKGIVGYPKKVFPGAAQFPAKGLEKSVAKTANAVLRKKLLAVPLIDQDVIGVMTVSHKKDKTDFNYFDLEILTTLAEEAVIAVKNAQLYEEQKKVTLGTIRALAVILGSRVTQSLPVDAVSQLVLRLADELKLREEESQALHYATLLKDTARVGIPEEILRKTSKLTGEEYRILRQHPIRGAQIVQSFESLKPVAPIILYSREKYDGSGYPEGLKGEAIPIGARILAVINAFEAIFMGRPYRNQSSLDEALAEIVRTSGTQFDPRVVQAFVNVAQDDPMRRLLKK